jgi:bla regulator protein BlaR1
MEYLLKASAVLIIFYVCYALFLKRETFFEHNRWFLLIGLITALILPTLVIPIYIEIATITIPETAFYISDTSNIAKPEVVFQWQSLIPIIYGLGFTVFLIQFVLQFGSLIILLLKNPKNKEGFYTYIIVKSKVSPFSFFKWIVYNPELYNNDELKLIINHEKVHVRQFHSIDMILTRLACVIFWFNPLIWFYKKDIQQNLEYIADYKTQTETNSEKDYQRLLLKTSLANQYADLTNNFYNSLIKKRILMLHKSRSKANNKWKFALILPLLTLFLMSANTKEIFVEKSTEVEQIVNSTNNTKLIEIIFSKEMSNESLDKIKAELKAQGITMTIENIDRNSKDEITAIDITFETENGSANYNIEDDKGIASFFFNYDGEDGFGVGPLKKDILHKTNIKHIKHVIKPNSNIKSKSNNVYVYSDYDVSKHVVEGKNGDENTFIVETEYNLDTIHFNGNVKTQTNGNYNFVSGDSIRFKYKSGDSIHLNKKNNFKISHRYYNVVIDSVDFNNNININNNRAYNIISSDSIKLHIDKDENISWSQDASNNKNTIILSQNTKPLFIIDGKKINQEKLKNLNPKKIVSVNVLKDKSAIDLYGKAAKNGVIVVQTNKNKKVKWVKDSANNIVVRGYYDETISKDASFIYINKSTSDNQLKSYKAQLKAKNIKAKFTKIKRNSAGEITSIKIALSDNKGAQSSATWRDNEDTIPRILVGKKGGKLRVSSSN